MNTIRNTDSAPLAPKKPLSVGFYALSEMMLSARPEALSVAFTGDERVSWPQFTADVAAWSEWLCGQKARRWALCFDDSYHFAVGFMAAAHAGKHLILPGNTQPAALAELIDQFDGLLHDRPDLAEIAHAYSLPENQPVSVTGLPFTALSAEQVSLTLFTSGSSGKPKAVGKSLSGLEAEIAALEHLWGADLAETQVVSTVSHQHIYGLLFRVLWPLCAGRPFSRQALDYPEQVMAHAKTSIVLITSPALLKRLGDNAVPADETYCAIFSSGGPLPLAAARQSQALLGSLPYEVFGSTETGGIGYRQQQDAQTCWQLFYPIEMSVNDQHCLQIRSPFINAKQWYQTDDLGELCGERQFVLKGRADRVVKIEEKRIALAEVERRLSQLIWVEEAAVLPLQQGERLALGAVLTLTTEGRQLQGQVGQGQFWVQLRRALRGWLEPVGIPRRFRVVEEMPVNRQGKRQVGALQRLFEVSVADHEQG
ncbi:AMP-binding protein [Photobacterium sp. TY1-4]|uniref:AMP-binding protein n=1 Tax=Photobacterium sp. TY1-4 TaxID=2899122 RepID=UPI0021C1DDC8|nr:AMP-binding protein [Photobacterium sp. TY1-4]UXI03738.1 AMP-binding protein [Photobacterium sp. TY1-4]